MPGTRGAFTAEIGETAAVKTGECVTDIQDNLRDLRGRCGEYMQG